MRCLMIYFYHRNFIIVDLMLKKRLITMKLEKTNRIFLDDDKL